MRSRLSHLLVTTTMIVVVSVSVAAGLPQDPKKPEPAAVPSRFMDLIRFAFLRDFFNLAQGTVRTVAIVSPTCPLCRKGVGEIWRSLEAIPGNRYRAFVIFSAELDGDTRERAAKVASQFHDRRLVYFWDAEKFAGESFKGIVGADKPVWDVYFLYDTDAVIDTTPPPPVIWMHQHNRFEAPELDGERLRSKILELLEKLEQRSREESEPEPDAGE